MGARAAGGGADRALAARFPEPGRARSLRGDRARCAPPRAAQRCLWTARALVRGLARAGGRACLLAGLLHGLGCSDADAQRARRLTGGDPERGRLLLDRYGCGACHHIPDVRGARGTVGPDLAGLALRSYLAGRLPNRPSELIRWIRHPQQLEPGSAMPELGVSESEARDMAAHLYTLTSTPR